MEDHTPTRLQYQVPETLWKDRIWILKNFFTQHECQAWIDFTEREGALLEHLQQRATRYLAARECFRCARDDRTTAHRIFERLQASQLFAQLPRFPGEEPSTCNPNLRLYKYEKGMSFGKHVDESAVISGVGVTRLTALIYLSGCTGGATRFQDTTFFDPLPGALLVHVHGDECLEHEADHVVSGIKYVLRTDIVYKKT